MLVLRSLAMAALATIAVVAVGAAPAHATQTPGQIEDQIDKQWDALEPVIENYDLIHQKYLAQKAQADKLQKQITPLEVQVQTALAQVNQYSTAVYENGPSRALNLLLNSQGAQDSIDMLGMLDAMATQQQKDVAGALKLQQTYETKKKPIDVLVASLNDQQAALSSQEKNIKAQIASLNKLRLQAYGNAGAGTGKLRPVACPYTYTGDQGSRAAKFACEQIGKPYVWDADGPGSYDCSGLTMASWRSVGVTLPHNAYQQKHTVPAVKSFSDLKPGDLMFYYPATIQHVGIYVGGGWIVNAPRTGEPVQMARYDHFPPAGYGRP